MNLEKIKIKLDKLSLSERQIGIKMLLNTDDYGFDAKEENGVTKIYIIINSTGEKINFIDYVRTISHSGYSMKEIKDENNNENNKLWFCYPENY
jgi:hypothetical protein